MVELQRQYIMIRFAMYGFGYENNFYEICRIIIEHKYQGQTNL